MLSRLERLRREHAELMARAPRGSDVYGAREARLAELRREIAEAEAANVILGVAAGAVFEEQARAAEVASDVMPCGCSSGSCYCDEGPRRWIAPAVRRLARVTLYAAAVAGVMLSSPPAGHSARPPWAEPVRSSVARVAGVAAAGRPWRIVWTVRKCPRGALCKRWWELERNYGQALKRERELEREGFAIVSLAQVAP